MRSEMFIGVQRYVTRSVAIYEPSCNRPLSDETCLTCVRSLPSGLVENPCVKIKSLLGGY
jgi:hypothetical protein